jgi:hypothetical protein
MVDGVLLLRDGRLIQRIGLDERVGIFRYPIETPPDSPSMQPNQFFSFTILSSPVLRDEDSCHSFPLTDPSIHTAKSQHSAKPSVLQKMLSVRVDISQNPPQKKNSAPPPSPLVTSS